MKALKVHMMFYMDMKENETKEEAINRFEEEFTTENVTTETSATIYEFGIEEFNE